LKRRELKNKHWLKMKRKRKEKEKKIITIVKIKKNNC